MAPPSVCRATTTWATARSATTPLVPAGSSTRGPSAFRWPSTAARSSKAKSGRSSCAASARAASPCTSSACSRTATSTVTSITSSRCSVAATKRACSARACTSCSTGATSPKPARSTTSTRSRNCLHDLNEQGGRDYRIASGGGRMFITMDRYNADWSMVERGWKHHVLGEGRGFSNATEAIQTLRDENPGMIDQDLLAFVIVDGEGKPVGPIRDGAAVVLFNFRGDRAHRAHPRVHRARAERVRPRPDSRRRVRRHDGIRRRPQASAALPRPTARDRPHHGRVPGPQPGQPVCLQRNAEIWPRDLLLERQPQRHVRRSLRRVRRDPERLGSLRTAALDEGRGDHRRNSRRPCGAAACGTGASTTPTATWSGTPATSMRRSLPSRPSTSAWRGSSRRSRSSTARSS